MELTFAVVLWAVRLVFLALLYLFLIRAFRALQRALVTETAAAATGAGLAYLVVQRSHAGGPRIGTRLPLRAVTTIGRDAGNDIVLNDDAASAKHAIVRLRDGAWWTEDAGSTNGTLVNATRIWDAERLRPGDEIDIGRIGLRLEETGPS